MRTDTQTNTRLEPSEVDNKASTIHVSSEETAGATAEDLTAEEVRQGHTGDHVRYVLLASFAGAIFVMAMLVSYFVM